MGFFRRIEDFFQKPPGNTIDFAEAERALRLKQLQEDNGPFSYTDEAFTYSVEGRNVTVRWADITRIVAYKLDKGAYDVDCIRILWDGGELVVCEEDAGWYQLISRLDNFLPGTVEWEENVK
ncbi:MAG TPA: hypothetical protein VG605_10200 [Puia sp.]|nr:hypothetical protein [Puia sp.]